MGGMDNTSQRCIMDEYITIKNIIIAHSAVKSLNYHDGLLYCQLLDNLYDDWRLPTMEDYLIIHSYCRKHTGNNDTYSYYSWIFTENAIDNAAAWYDVGSINDRYDTKLKTTMNLTVIPVRDVKK